MQVNLSFDTEYWIVVSQVFKWRLIQYTIKNLNNNLSGVARLVGTGSPKIRLIFLTAILIIYNVICDLNPTKIYFPATVNTSMLFAIATD